jgi:CRISPR-associated protein Cas2
MTVVVTRNASSRMRGFLASCMCEIAPGIYTSPRMTAAVRDRVWAVMERWRRDADDLAVVMTWPDKTLPGGQVIQTLGIPRTDVVNVDGIWLTRRMLTPF